MFEETVEDTSSQETSVQNEASTTESAQQQEQQAKMQARETEQANNFRAIKKAAEQAARERDEFARRLQEYESVNRVESPDEDFGMKEDDLVEGKHLAKYAKRIKQLEDQQRQYMQQNQESTAEIRLKAQYPDFDKVMTLENVQTFSQAYPELAKSINSASDLYDKASSAYTLIKKFGIYEEVPFEAEKQKALANAAKPRPLASVSPQQGDSPLSRANAFAEGLTDDLKTQLRKEMEEARKLY
jgi:hypothetical protein